MNSKISKYQPKKKYQSDGNNKVICCVRKRLIKSNPEEDFRQAFIAYLIQEKGYPINRIEIEHSLAKIEKGDKRRADIVVYDCDDKANAILVIECKKTKTNYNR